jgi:hypothetical protein
MRTLEILKLATISLVISSAAFASNSNHGDKPGEQSRKNPFKSGNVVDNRKGKMLYESILSSKYDIVDWVMEGPGVTEFEDNWMHMYSPDERFHHVFWCPQEFPASFVAEWELQNLETDAGLCVVLFAAQGNKGEDIFDSSFPKRNGTFRHYTQSSVLHNYHISYYANSKDVPERGYAVLRKNKGLKKLQNGEHGIPVKSKEIHKMRLVKDGGHITLFVDGRRAIDYTDRGTKYGPIWKGGKIGLRQMKWTHFRYRNFRVWELKN